MKDYIRTGIRYATISLGWLLGLVLVPTLLVLGISTIDLAWQNAPFVLERILELLF